MQTTTRENFPFLAILLGTPKTIHRCMRMLRVGASYLCANLHGTTQETPSRACVDKLALFFYVSENSKKFTRRTHFKDSKKLPGSGPLRTRKGWQPVWKLALETLFTRADGATN
jgi:hypothetical protein